MRFKGKDGFTLVELLVAIAIIAVLATIAFPIFKSRTNGSADGNAQADLKRAAGVATEVYNASALQSESGAAKSVDSFPSCGTMETELNDRAADLTWAEGSGINLGPPTDIAFTCEGGDPPLSVVVCNKSASGHFFCVHLNGVEGGTGEGSSLTDKYSSGSSLVVANSSPGSTSESAGWE